MTLELVEQVAIGVDEEPPFLLPTTYTPALSDVAFETDGPRLRQFVEAVWRTPEHPDGLKLDLWQAWLIDRMLERYPKDHPNPARAGRLRYRQIVVSIPRQNGKSVIGAIFALYGLMMHERGPVVLGVASSAEQARVVYNRVLFVIQSNPQLARMFSKMTETRGITTKDGTGTYTIKASKGDALQGQPTSMSIIDELHITNPDVWQSLVKGQKTRKNGMTIGITTAGDDDSKLLKDLYEKGNKSAAGDPRYERLGFFCWQAPESIVPDDDKALGHALRMSNPMIYEGRVELDSAISDARMTPETDVIRYDFNLFTASKAAFIPLEKWAQAQRAGDDFPTEPAWIAIDRTPEWGYATITASVRVGWKTHTEVVASIIRPDLEQLVGMCVELSAYSPAGYIVDGYAFRDLGKALELQGLKVRIATQGDMLTASSLLYAKIMRGQLVHSGDRLLSRQVPRTIRKNIGDGFRISRQPGAEIDAVISTALGVLAADTQNDPGQQLF